jgi:nucleotide-binding universal stress UspA family protein
VTDKEQSKQNECPDRDEFEGEGPVMLALSTFRRSEEAEDKAIELMGDGGRLIIVYVADVDVARYLLGSDVGVFEDLKEKTERELLEEHVQRGERAEKRLVDRAHERGADNVESRVDIGHFANEVLKDVEKYKPKVIVTTHSNRPWWVRKLFGSHVDILRQKTGCPVIEV